jgi:hypothetical protein
MIRPIVTLHLPLDMGAVGRICGAVAREYPDATVTENFVISAEADDYLTKAERKAISRERAKVWREGSQGADR